MLKYGPTINMVIAELTSAPNRNMPPASTPKIEVEIPNTVNIIPIIAVTAKDRTKDMIINPM